MEIAFGNWFKIAEGREPLSMNRGVFSLRMKLDARRLTQEFAYNGPVLVYDAMTANPGAPGGPLVNLDGQCIGIVGRLVESSATNTRINYALPSEEVLAFIGGNVKPAASGGAPDAEKAKPYIGISISRLGFRHVSPYVARVRAGSPAHAAGVRPDDLVLMVNGQRIGSAEAFHAAVARLTPGSDAELVLKRGREIVTVTLKVEAAK